MVEILWKMWNVLYRMGKILKKIYDIYFSSYGVILSTKIIITRKIKIGNLVFLSFNRFQIFHVNLTTFEFFFILICMDLLQNQFFFLNFDERSSIGWIERITNFQIFAIFIFRVMVILVSFFWKNTLIFDNNSKNKNRRIILLFFPFHS